LTDEAEVPEPTLSASRSSAIFSKRSSKRRRFRSGDAFPAGHFRRPDRIPEMVGSACSRSINQSTVAKSSIPSGDSKPSIRFVVESSARFERLRPVLFKERVDIFPAVLIEPDGTARACVTPSLVAMEIGSVEGVEQMTKPIRVGAIFSIRFHVIKKYVGLFEVARIWAGFAPVALKALLACAN
jgi:hypothetical protein